MKAEYDFSKGERGKHADAVFRTPIYLEKDVNEFMQHLADVKEKDVGELVNELLRHNIQLINPVKHQVFSHHSKFLFTYFVRCHLSMIAEA